MIWAGIFRESSSLCHTLEAGGAVLKAGRLAAKRAHAYRGRTGSGSQLTCLLPVHVGFSSQLGGWVPRAVCVCVCGMCVGTINFITYFQTSSIISATLLVVKTVTDSHRFNPPWLKGRGLRCHFLKEEWQSPGRACGMEILWPLLGSTICHIPALKHDWCS